MIMPSYASKRSCSSTELWPSLHLYPNRYCNVGTLTLEHICYTSLQAGAALRKTIPLFLNPSQPFEYIPVSAFDDMPERHRTVTRDAHNPKVGGSNPPRNQTPQQLRRGPSRVKGVKQEHGTSRPDRLGTLCKAPKTDSEQVSRHH